MKNNETRALAEKEHKCKCGFHPVLNPYKFNIIFCEYSPLFHSMGVRDHWSATCYTCQEEIINECVK
jgi:hypothetical protein